MGQHVSNVGVRAHGKATDPTSAQWELWHHHGDKSLDEVTAINSANLEQLIADAKVSQAAFDATMGGLVSWYGFPTHMQADRDLAREAMRKAVLLFDGLAT